MPRLVLNSLATVTVLTGLLGNALSCGLYAPEPLARVVLDPDPLVAAGAVDQLRRLGPAGLDLLFDTFATELQRETIDSRLLEAIDRVAAQKDAHASGLFWHTDLTAALARARAEGKPVLSLRLLGRLDSDLSCANSRFFRTVLYANRRVADHLRRHYVLHWQSVRPVPVVTIDFGDGRQLKRTITGNSLHLVLDDQGRPLDAIAGLYGPGAFLETLARIEQLRSGMPLGSSPQWETRLRDFHAARLSAVIQQWNGDLKSAGVAPADPSVPGAVAPITSNAVVVPTALEAAPVAITKMVVEMPILERLDGPMATARNLTQRMDSGAWQKIAALRSEQGQLDHASIALMRRKLAGANGIGDATDLNLDELVKNFQQSVAEDTVRNEYLLHPRIHEWFARGFSEVKDANALTERIYAELFLTPSRDPWLGLAPVRAYAALDGNGLTPQREF